MPLSSLHSRFPGSVRWQVTPAGVGIDGAAPVGTAGEPVTVRRVFGWFSEEIRAASLAYHVPSALLVAVICTESAGGQPDLAQVLAARREEPGYVTDEVTPWRVSTGCCQTLLSTARMVLEKPSLTTLDLQHPAMSINACAAYIAAQSATTMLDPPLVAACYNAGGLYQDPTPANRWRMRCYPLGTGGYIDSFVCWYNDAVTVARAGQR